MINRRTLARGLGSLALGLPPVCYAQSRPGNVPPWGAWKIVPSIVVVSAEDDSRLPVVHDAVRFWNAELSKLGSPFQLDTIIHVPGILPVDDLRPFADFLAGKPPGLPNSIHGLSNDVVIALSDGKFRSFTYGFPVPRKILVGIANLQTHPLSMPNGALNVIAHELGHVIGLGHNNDGASLMCGIETAWCHFSYPADGVLVLTIEEKRRLLDMYPLGWQPVPPSRWKGDPVVNSHAG